MKKTLLSAAAIAATLFLGSALPAQEREEPRDDRQPASEARSDEARSEEGRSEDANRENAERRDAQSEGERREAQPEDAQRREGDRPESRTEERDPNRAPPRGAQPAPGAPRIQPAPGALPQAQPGGTIRQPGTIDQFPAPGQGQAQRQGGQNRFALGIRLDAAAGEIMIEEVVPDSPAAEAGLQEGDMIRGINGREPRNVNEFLSAVGQIRQGEAIELEVEREGEMQQIEVTPAPWNEVFTRPAAGQPRTTFRPNFAGGQGMSREMEALRQQVQQLQREVEALRARIGDERGPGAAPRGPRPDGAAPRPAPEGIDAPPAREARPDAPRREESRQGRGDAESRDQAPERNREQPAPRDAAPPSRPETN